jgi:hypothetical protein
MVQQGKYRTASYSKVQHVEHGTARYRTVQHGTT